jgi:uncharacterized membrane protein
MSSKDPANDIKNPPSQTPTADKGKKKVRIRKGGKWTEIDIDDIIQKSRFKYVKFTDDDGLETYWISQE